MNLCSVVAGTSNRKHVTQPSIEIVKLESIRNTNKMKSMRLKSLSTVASFGHKTLPDKVTIQVISSLSIISSLTSLITFLIIFSSNQSWFDVKDYVLHWLADNNININVSIDKSVINVVLKNHFIPKINLLIWVGF